MVVFLQVLLGLAALLCVPIGWMAMVRMRYEPRRPVPWDPLDLALVVATSFVALSVAIAVSMIASGGSLQELVEPTDGQASDAPGIRSPNQLMALLLAQGVVNLVVMGAAILWLRARHRTSAADLGFSTRFISRDLLIGGISFLGLLLPTFALKWLLDALIQPTQQHPVISLLEDDPSPAMMGAALFTAFLVAPLTEEFFYRVLLQGWLEKLACRGRKSESPAADVENQSEVVNADVASDATGLEPGIPASDNPSSAPQVETTEDQSQVATELDTADEKPPWWPVIVSSAIFALMHYSHGTDPLVLFFFALALGYLYRQTHRLWPSVVVHMLLNGLSLTALFLSVGK